MPYRLVILGAMLWGQGLGAATIADYVYLIDHQTQTVLMEKNASAPISPASMSKLMTLYIVFEELKAGRLKMEDTFWVSKKAWKTQGSKMFVPVGEKVRVEDLLRGVIVQSGNDASIVLAEGLAGSEDKFVNWMNEKAQQLGLKGSIFFNASGLPYTGQGMTLKDIALLSQRLIEDFPEYYPLFAEKVFTYSGIKQQNRNTLLWDDFLGVDGLKTGHTSEAGYGLAASAYRGGKRLVLVIAGLKTMQVRNTEVSRLLDWGFRNFVNYKLASKGEVIAMIPVWQGKKRHVPLVAEQDMFISLPRQMAKAFEGFVTYTEPLQAPLVKGQTVGTLSLETFGKPYVSFPLVVGEEVKKAFIFQRSFRALSYLLWGLPVAVP